MIKITRKNPKNENLLKTLKIKKIIPIDFKRIDYTPYDYFYTDLGDIVYLVEDLNKNSLGFAIYSKRNETISSISILKDYQRQGIASFLYDYIEKDLHIRLRPSSILLSDGEAFWENRMKKKNPIKFKKRNPNKKLLILDIDETLVFVDNKYFFKPYKKLEPDFAVLSYFGVKRPFLDQFLRDISKKYDLALWTSGNKEYAEEINELIFKPLKIKLKFIFSNEDLIKGQKDLDIVIDNFPEYSKKDVIAIDDNKEYFLNDLDNLITIKKFHGNQNDMELIRVFKLL